MQNLSQAADRKKFLEGAPLLSFDIYQRISNLFDKEEKYNASKKELTALLLPCAWCWECCP